MDKSDNSWTIEDNEISIELSKHLLPSRTQDEHIQVYPKLASYPEIFHIGKILYNNSVKEKDQIIKFLRNAFNNQYILTSSGVLYKSNEKDIIIHDKGLTTEEIIKVDFVGPDRYIKKDDESNLVKLTGLNNLDEIKEISQFLTGKNKTYLWRVNDKPEKDDYRVARFDAYSDRAYLNCIRNPSNSNPALGVRSAKNFLHSTSENLETKLYSEKEIRGALKRLSMKGIVPFILEELKK